MLPTPKLRSFLVCTIALLAAATAAAQNTIHVPKDQPTIQAGINAANTGDTVLVSPGTYYENIDFLGKAIIVTSTSGTGGGAANTIIDGSKGTIQVVNFDSGEPRSAILNGFTIQNGGHEGYGGSIPIAPGIYIGNASPTIVNNILTHNHCYSIESDGAPLIQNNEIDNTLDTLGDCSFAGGAAIYLDADIPYSSATPIVPIIIGNLLQNNTQSGLEDAGGNGGAGVADWIEFAIIEDNTIRNNLSYGQGTAIHLFGNGGLVVGNLAYNNQSGGGGGGLDVTGFYVYFSIYPTFNAFIANNTFANNTYIGGGGISNDYAVDQIYFGSYGQVSPTFAFANNIVYGNSANPAVQCGWSGGPAPADDQLVLDHNLFYNAGGPIFSPLCSPHIGTYGNINADPKFVDPSNGNFSLAAGSPAIDAGNNGVLAFLGANGLDITTDLEGHPRLQDATGKGYPIIDIGALEATGPNEQNATTLLLTPSGFEAAAGQSFNLAVQAFSPLGTPGGGVTFIEDQTNNLGSVALDNIGSATFSPPLTPGIHHFFATYPGQGLFSPARSVEIIVVVSNYQPSLSIDSSANPSNLGQSVKFTATISSGDTNELGPITVTDDLTNTTLATLTPDSSGKASFSTSSLSLGYHSVEADYGGDSTHSAASAVVLQDVITGYATSATLTCNPTTINTGATSLLSALVTSTSGTPTGTITFTDGTTNLFTAPLANGGASDTYTGTSAGIHTITATYVPTGSFAASSATCSVTVNGVPTITKVAVGPNPSTYGQPVVFSTNVKPTTPNKLVPSGKVVLTFCHGATTTLTLDANGNGSAIEPTGTEIAEPVSSCSFTGQYSGDTTFNSSTSDPAVYQVTPSPSTTTIVTASPNPANLAQPVTFTMQVTGTPSPTADPVTGNPVPPGSLQFAGTLQLFDGTSPVATAPVTAISPSTGQATITLSTLAVGPHSITATYSNDPNLGTSTSPAVIETILAAPPPDFTFIGPQTITFRTEANGVATLSLASLNGFAAPIAVTCNAPLPPNYLCTLSSSTVTLAANNTASLTLTLHPNLNGHADLQSPRGLDRSRAIVPIAFATLFPLTLFALTRRRRRNLLHSLLLLLCLAATATALTACGSDIYYPATPPGLYPITLTSTGTNQGSSTPTAHTLKVDANITR